MIFAAKIPAEPGWKVALARSDGSVSFIELKEWGLQYCDTGTLVMTPLDYNGMAYHNKLNFIQVINPNMPECEMYDLQRHIKEVARALAAVHHGNFQE